MSRAAVALADRGVLSRAANPADGRSHLLVLSASGHELHAAIVPRALQLQARIVAALDDGDLDAFVPPAA